MGAYIPVPMCQKFTTMERNLLVWDKEAVAVKLALSPWYYLLEGALTPFEIWRNHKNLEALIFQF